MALESEPASVALIDPVRVQALDLLKIDERYPSAQRVKEAFFDRLIELLEAVNLLLSRR